jgi:formylglycine-generating enzyme required for sulfatase activity
MASGPRSLFPWEALMRAAIIPRVVLPFALAFASLPLRAEPDRTALARKAHDILKANCYRCHGRDGAVEGGINYILDPKTLAARKKAVAGEPAKSKLYKRLVSEDDPMPPEGEKVRPGKDDIAVIKQWIAAGMPAVEAAEARRPFLAETDVIAAIAADLKKADEADRRFLRYFTITHLVNAGLSDDELQTYRHGLSKLVNSLSWGRRVVVPRAVDAARTVLRIDLRDYQWSPATWTRIMGYYPYAIVRPGPEARFVYDSAEGEIPYVRADWFVYHASRPPLYHEVLRVPWTDRELEKQLRVDVAADVEAGQVARCAFNGSGISRHNRLIERHESPYGAYWKSYDFASSAGQQNLFAYPFGPGGGTHDFQHDGGEIIFTLPNGLQGYMLVNAEGHRLDEGPTRIVSDPRQPDRAVVNGISCMGCHVRGVIEKADQLREHAARNPAGFSEREAAQVKALYPAPEKLAGLFREDADRFRAAVEKAGLRVASTEPVVALAMRLDGEMDLPLAAAELGLTPGEFRERLARSPALQRTLGSLNVDGGTVQRGVFESEYGEAARELHVGFARTVTNSIGMKLNFIPPGEFWMGTPDEDTATRYDERPRHKVRITRPFYMGIYPVTQEQFRKVAGSVPSWFGEARGGRLDWPVENVPWETAVSYCHMLSNLAEEKRAGRRYRLPTEAEWEYACRAGTSTRFAFGDLITAEQAAFGRGGPGQGGHPVPVGRYAPNRFGLYDVHGNVWQWCADWYDRKYYTYSPQDDPQGPGTFPQYLRAEYPNGLKVKRGGAYGEPLFWCRSAARMPAGAEITERNPLTGFRVVCVQEGLARVAADYVRGGRLEK